MEKYDYYNFTADVRNALIKKLYKLATTYTDNVDNTRTPFIEREHFLSTNITSIINRIFIADTITISRVNHRIEDYDEVELGEEKLYKNRQDFLKEIEDYDEKNIINFIFLTFRLS